MFINIHNNTMTEIHQYLRNNKLVIKSKFARVPPHAHIQHNPLRMPIYRFGSEKNNYLEPAHGVICVRTNDLAQKECVPAK